VTRERISSFWMSASGLQQGRLREEDEVVRARKILEEQP